MAPVHDTDLAESRWTQTEWEHYELWEKVEQRNRWKRRMWIAGTLVLFLMISAVPVVRGHWERWAALSAARRLSQEVNWVKRESNLRRTPLLIRILPAAGSAGGLHYRVESVAGCGSAGQVVKEGTLATGARLAWLSPQDGEALKLPGLVTEFCYDPLKGSQHALLGREHVGLAIIPAKDLTEGSSRRIVLLVLSGISGEISFDSVDPT